MLFSVFAFFWPQRAEKAIKFLRMHPFNFWGAEKNSVKFTKSLNGFRGEGAYSVRRNVSLHATDYCNSKLSTCTSLLAWKCLL